MPQQKKRAAARRSEPKVFRCTGFGDCDMVFTRSEHLARHARKHTGEKPFKCVVPNCNRMFSRFDNMMQHTHTHNKRTSTTKKTEQKKYCSSRSSASSSVPSSPNTPNNEQNIYVEQKTILPHSDNNNYYYHHHHYYHPQPAPQQNYPMIIKPMPISPSSTFNPSSFSDSEQQQPTPIVSPRTFSDTIELSTYLHDLTGKSLYSNNSITSDEFEAIQGLGEFYTKPIIRETFMNQQPTHYSVTALLSNHSPSTTLSAFRQYNTPTAHESSIRHW